MSRNIYVLSILGQRLVLHFRGLKKPGAPLSTPNARALVFSTPTKRTVNEKKHLRTFNSGVKARAPLSEFEKTRGSIIDPKC